MSTQTFQEAIGKLVSDAAYGKAVATDGRLLQRDFGLSSEEMAVMNELGLKTGWVKPSAAADTYCCCCCTF